MTTVCATALNSPARRGLVLHRLATLPTAVLATGVLLSLLLGMAAWAAIRNEYRNEVAEILHGSERTAQKLAAHTAEVLDGVSQSTRLVKHLHEHNQLPPLRSLSAGGVLANEATRVVMVADARGFISDSTSDLIALNIADEDDFKAHKRRADLNVTVGVASPDPLGDGWVIPVSRRLNLPDGKFGGLVTATINPAGLSERDARSEAPDTAVGVVGFDGIYRSRTLGGKVTFGEKVDVASLERRAVEIHELRHPFKSPIDGVERFVAVARVPGYPFLAVVAVNAESALSGYRHARSTVVGWASAAAFVLLMATLLLRIKIGELQRSRRQTQQAEAALRAALEGSLDAVSILSARRGTDGQLVDFLIADCNSRAAGLIGRSRDEVVGELLCSLAPSIRTGGFMAQFDQVIRTGRSSSSEVEATDPHLVGRWLHHQVVPLGDGIALISRDVTERRADARALAGLAHHDSLTQLGNRRDFERRLPEAHARACRSGDTLALLFIDLDGFKAINDTHGHSAGDAVLVEVARRLRECVRLTDTVNRLGGDEFTLMLEGAGTVHDVEEKCALIIRSLSQPHEIEGRSLTSTPSVGVALLWPGEGIDSLQRRADAAMYFAKRAGKATHHVSESAGMASSGDAEPADALARAHPTVHRTADRPAPGSPPKRSDNTTSGDAQTRGEALIDVGL